MMARATLKQNMGCVEKIRTVKTKHEVLTGDGFAPELSEIADKQLPSACALLQASLRSKASTTCSDSPHDDWALRLDQHSALDKLLRVSGRSLPDMLGALSSALAPCKDPLCMLPACGMHCTEVCGNRLELHYCHGAVDDDSSAALLDGLIRLAACRYHGIQGLQVQRAVGSRQGTGAGTGPGTKADSTCGEQVLGDRSEPTVFHLTVPPGQPSFDTHLRSLAAAEAEARSSERYAWTDAAALYQCFPFHLVLDTECRVMQAGSALMHLCPGTFKAGTRAADHLTVTHPAGLPWDLPQLLQYGVGASRRSTLVVRTAQGLTLKGSLVMTRMAQAGARAAAEEGQQQQEVALFIGAPVLQGAADLERYGLCLSDLAPHDLSSDRVLDTELRDHNMGELRVEVESLRAKVQRLEAEQAQLRAQAEQQHNPSRWAAPLSPNTLAMPQGTSMALQLIERMLRGDSSQVTFAELWATREALLAGQVPHSPGMLSGGSLCHAAAVPQNFGELAGDDAEVNECLRDLLMPLHRTSARAQMDLTSDFETLMNMHDEPLERIDEGTESMLSILLPTLWSPEHITSASGMAASAAVTSGPASGLHGPGSSGGRQLLQQGSSSNRAASNASNAKAALSSAPAEREAHMETGYLDGPVTSLFRAGSGYAGQGHTQLLHSLQQQQQQQQQQQANQALADDFTREAGPETLQHTRPQVQPAQTAQPSTGSPGQSNGGTALASGAQTNTAAARKPKRKSSLRKFQSFIVNMLSTKPDAKSDAKAQVLEKAATGRIPDWQASESMKARSRSCDVPSSTYSVARASTPCPARSAGRRAAEAGIAMESGGDSQASAPVPARLRMLRLRSSVSRPELLSHTSSSGITTGTESPMASMSILGLAANAVAAASSSVRTTPDAAISHTGTLPPTARTSGISTQGDAVPQSISIGSFGGFVPVTNDAASMLNKAVKLAGGPPIEELTPRVQSRTVSNTSSSRRYSTTHEGNRLPSDASSRQASQTQSTPDAQRAAVLGLLRVCRSPSEELARVLSKVDDWQFDSFALNDATNERPLSVLAFVLFQRAGIVKRFGINQRRLASFLLKIEEGYPPNPYHNRLHAADVLRTLHVIATRGGLVRLVTPEQPLQSGELFAQPQQALQHSPLSSSLMSAFSSIGSTVSAGPGVEGEQVLPAHEAFMLLTVYLAAIIHDYEHKGVSNPFLIKTADPLALRYNDMSPMENHHLAAAFTLMQEPAHNFLGKASGQVLGLLRSQVIELALSTDMKQHFTTMSMFDAKVQAAKQQLQLSYGAEASAADPSPSPSPAYKRNSHTCGGQPGAGSTLGAVAVLAAAAAPPAAGSTGAAAGRRHSMRRQQLPSPPLSPLLSPRAQQRSSWSLARGDFLMPRPDTNDSLVLPKAPLAECSWIPGCADAAASAASAELWQHDKVEGAIAFAAAAANRPLGDSAHTATPGQQTLSAAMSEMAFLLRQTSQDFMIDVMPGPDPVHAGRSPPSAVSAAPGPRAAAHQGSMRGAIRTPGSSAPFGSFTTPVQPITEVSSLDDESRLLMWKIALKCADLGHLASPRDVHRRWVTQLEEEMFRQGDRERAAGMAVSPLMDRNKTGITKSQPGFFNVVALPMYNAFVAAFPAVAPLLAGVQDNHAMWQEAQQQQQQQQPAD